MRHQQFIALMYGWVVTLGLIILASIVLAGLLRFTPLNEPHISWIALGIGFIALFIGGLVAGAKSKTKGWIIGAITGAGFTLFIFAIQYLFYEQAFSLEQTLHHFGYILAAIVGGILGVNTIIQESD